MESVIGQLQRILIGNRNNLEAIFAKQALQNFQQGIFPSQRELSETLFISDSVITKICKKLGYSGFRQFNERLRFEYQRYQLDRHHIISDSNIIQEMLKKSLAGVNQNNEFVIKFRQAVNETKNLVIFSGYQAEEAGVFLRDYLLSKNYCARIWNPAKNYVASLKEFLHPNDPILFIFTGPDNYRNYSNYETIKDSPNHEVFVITTFGQSDNFDLPQTNKYVLKSNLKYSNPFVREVLLELLFLEAFE